MRYAQIREFDVANGPGVRTTIFVTGCTLGCKNCFNKEYQDFNYGDIWTENQTNQI
ncbi:MAG: 4Fe-4S cluster-binding domain-containing protein, partial [Miniphocaeibacter sp.]|uniref:4Fe-4S cluster-binding domain-containing protein n=1 Tax=Miniphocaeibacter sp. TaxID=3100973 RepID=UPI003BB1A253